MLGMFQGIATEIHFLFKTTQYQMIVKKKSIVKEYLAADAETVHERSTRQ